MVSEQNMQGRGMNQGTSPDTMQMNNGQYQQDDPYTAYRQWDQSGAYQQAQQPYAPYTPYTPYTQGNQTGSYQGSPQMYTDPQMQQPFQGSPQMVPDPQMQQSFQGQYIDYQAMANQQPVNGFNSGPYKVPQVSMATGEQVLYNAPMAPGEGQQAQIPVPQMSRDGLSESPRIHVGKGNTKKKVLTACGIVVALLAIGALVYFSFFAGKTAYTAENVVEALYKRGLPIESPLIYTENTDPDGLLGTMNQYTSKVSWTDRRVSNGTDTLSQGGIVEVFPSAELAQGRLRQLNLMLPSQAGAASQVNRAVMRLSTGLTSEQIAEYQDALKQMFGK